MCQEQLLQRWHFIAFTQRHKFVLYCSHRLANANQREILAQKVCFYHVQHEETIKVWKPSGIRIAKHTSWRWCSPSMNFLFPQNSLQLASSIAKVWAWSFIHSAVETWKLVEKVAGHQSDCTAGHLVFLPAAQNCSVTVSITGLQSSLLFIDAKKSAGLRACRQGKGLCLGENSYEGSVDSLLTVFLCLNHYYY